MKYFDTLGEAITASNDNNKKLINILLKNGWINTNNSSPPKNAIEIFSYHYNVECNDSKGCKNVTNQGTVYRTDKNAISLRDAHKKLQTGGSNDIYFHKYLKYKKKYIDTKH